jgi:hypothetical protein
MDDVEMSISLKVLCSLQLLYVCEMRDVNVFLSESVEKAGNEFHSQSLFLILIAKARTKVRKEN